MQRSIKIKHRSNLMGVEEFNFLRSTLFEANCKSALAKGLGLFIKGGLRGGALGIAAVYFFLGQPLVPRKRERQKRNEKT